MVPAPKNLQFSDTTQTSFVASWEHGAPDVALYRIGWTKKEDGAFQYVSLKLKISEISCTSIRNLLHRKTSGPATLKTLLLSQREHGKNRLLL